jgi:hypothetical protein
MEGSMAIYVQDKEIIPPGAGKSVFYRAVLLAAILALAGCFSIDDGFNPEDWSWDAGDGKVYIRIALNAARFAVDLDNPTQEHIGYFEAIFKESGLPNAYYIGSAVAGEEYITVAVPYGKTYDILVLAGTPANGQALNGVKVLLASGMVSYPVIYGQNVVSVPMKLHKTADAFVKDGTASGNAYEYTPTITGIQALLSAQASSGKSPLITSAQAYLAHYPNPYEGVTYTQPQVGTITANSASGGTLRFPVTGTLPDNAQDTDIYSCCYNLTYHAFSDAASGSSPWDIRRGIINQMYTEEDVFGGGVPLGYCYYVSANGDDSNIGYQKEQPFKTLAKAVKAVREKTIPWIKTIAVLGELNLVSESSANYPGYQVSSDVFVIPNLQAGENAVDLIRITGDPALTGGIPAVLSGVSGKWVLSIAGTASKIQLDHIKITGSSGGAGGGVRVWGGAELTVQDGALITGNKNNGNRASNTAGGGVQVNNAKLVMRGGEISGNDMTSRSASGNAGVGGGVFITGGGSFEMSGGVIKGNTAQFAVGVYVFNGIFKMIDGLIRGNIADGGTPGGGAGVEVASGATFEMSGGEIRGNQHLYGSDSSSGGGGVWVNGTFKMYGTARIANNSSCHTGGGVCVSGAFNLDTSGGACVTGNTANTGDNVYKKGTFILNGISQPGTVFNSPIP